MFYHGDRYWLRLLLLLMLPQKPVEGLDLRKPDEGLSGVFAIPSYYDSNQPDASARLAWPLML